MTLDERPFKDIGTVLQFFLYKTWLPEKDIQVSAPKLGKNEGNMKRKLFLRLRGLSWVAGSPSVRNFNRLNGACTSVPLYNGLGRGL